LRCEAAGSDRALVFGHKGSPKLRSTLSAAIADLAGTGRRVARDCAEIPGGKIWHRTLRADLNHC